MKKVRSRPDLALHEVLLAEAQQIGACNAMHAARARLFFYEGPLFWGKVGIAVVGIVLALIFQRVGDRMLGYLRAP